MRNPIINRTNHTIEITKSFDKASRRAGTFEYDLLVSIKRDYPRYNVVVKSPTKKSTNTKSLEFDFINKYIICFDTNPEETIQEFNYLKDDKSIGNVEITTWFVEKYPN